MEDGRSSDDLRATQGFPAFEQDIFLSYRFAGGGGSTNPKLENLIGHLKSLNFSMKWFESPEERLEVAQYDAVRSSRIIIVLLEQSRMLHNSPGKWGQQYRELISIAELYKDGRALLGEQERRKILPYTLICYFGDKGDKDEAIEELLPSSSEDRPRRDANVYQYLKSTSAWKHIAPGGADEPDAAWLTEVLDTVRRRGAEKGAGSGGEPSGRDARRAPHFDYEGYCARRVHMWERGSPFILPPVASEDAFDLSGGQPISLSGRLETPMQDGPLLDEIKNVVDELLQGDRSLWILGQPGAGKTTVLTQSAATEAQAFGAGAARGVGVVRYPMVFVLKRFDKYVSDRDPENLPGSLVELMAEDIRADGDQCDSNALNSFFVDHPYSLYLDGFDELSDRSREHIVNLIGHERNLHRHSRVIISCRTGYEHKGLEGQFGKLRLRMLDVAKLDAFIDREVAGADPHRAETLRAGFASLRASFAEDEAADVNPLRTPFFLRLILQENMQARQILGSEEMIYTKALSLFFKRVCRVADEGLAEFDLQEALTELAWRYVKKRRITDGLIAEVASKALEGRQKTVEATRYRRISLIERMPVLQGTPAADSSYGFRHMIFAEYLAAADVAKRWYTSSVSGTGRSALEEKRGRLIRDIVGHDPPFSDDRPAIKLIHRVPHIFFDTTVFPDLRVVPDESEPSTLAGEFCTALATLVRDARLENREARARAAHVVLELVEALGGLKPPSFHRRDLDRSARELQAAYREQSHHWSPAEREAILGAIAKLDKELWENITGAGKGPVELPSVELDVPIWAAEGTAIRLDVGPLRVSRKPVLVAEYGAFCQDPNRYDHRFWPTRTDAERDEAERTFVTPLSEGRSIEPREDTDYSKFCVIADVPARNRVLDHWREQRQHHPYRPVTNVAWREAVAYALWLSEKEGRNYRLPGPVEWSHIVSAVGPAEIDHNRGGTAWPNLNIGSAGLPHLSTVGVFPPNRLGLLDFGSNVSIWLNQFDAVTMNSPWPPKDNNTWAFHCGPNHLSRDAECSLTLKPEEVQRRKRRPWIGIWLVEAG